MKTRPFFKLTDRQLKYIAEQDIILDKSSSDRFKSNRKKNIKMYFGEPEDQTLNIETEKTASQNAGNDFNTTIPLTTMAQDKTHARSFLSIQQQRPYCKFAPTEGTDQALIEKTEEFFDYYLFNEVKEFETILDEGLYIWINEGQWIPSVHWDKIIAQTIRHYGPYDLDNPITGLPVTPEDLINQILEISEERIIEEIELLSEDYYKISYKEKNPLVNPPEWNDKKAKIDFYIDENENLIRAIYYGEKVDFDGAVINNENLDFIYFPSDAKNFSLTNCGHLILQYSLHIDDLRRLADEGHFDIKAEDWDKIEKVGSLMTEESGSSGITKEIREQVDLISHYNREITTIHLVDCYYYLDVNDDGYREKVLFTGVLSSSESSNITAIIRKKLIDEILPISDPPLVLIKFDIIPYTAFGRSLPDKGKHLQEAMNDVWNQKLNYGETIMLPWGLQSGSIPSPLSKGEPVRLKRGTLVNVPDVNKVVFPHFQNNLAVADADMQMIYAMWERVHNVNDQLMGKAGGARTATATLRLLSEASQNMSLNFMRLSTGMQKLYLMLYQYVYAYISKVKAYRIMGPDGNYIFKKITREELIQHPDIKVNIDMEMSSKLYRREIMTFLFDKLVNPLFMQLGIIGKTELYNAGVSLLRAFDEKNYDRWLRKPADINELQDPATENYITTSGGLVRANPEEDHNQHLASHTMDLQSLPAGIPIERRVAKIHHIMEHQRIFQEMQQMMQFAQTAMTSPESSASAGREGEFVINPQENINRGEFTQAYGRSIQGMGDNTKALTKGII